MLIQSVWELHFANHWSWSILEQGPSVEKLERCWSCSGRLISFRLGWWKIDLGEKTEMWSSKQRLHGLRFLNSKLFWSVDLSRFRVGLKQTAHIDLILKSGKKARWAWFVGTQKATPAVAPWMPIDECGLPNECRALQRLNLLMEGLSSRGVRTSDPPITLFEDSAFGYLLPLSYPLTPKMNGGTAASLSHLNTHLEFDV